VNFHDVYIRNGSYAGWMALPGIPPAAHDAPPRHSPIQPRL
jgi:hypothetical protein